MNNHAQSAKAQLSSQTFTYTVSQNISIQYLCALPTGYQSGGTNRWPLLLSLHGAGERGTNLDRVAIHGPMSHVKQGREFPFIIVAPQCPENQRWENEPLLRLLDHIIQTHAVDTNRIYLTGLSMGGYGTWSLGLAHPERFAAIAPICGGANAIDIILGARDRGVKFQSLPIRAYHGAKDDVVPLEESQRVVDMLKRNGAVDVKLTIYPEAKHDSWKEPYRGSELYEWLLSHSLDEPARSGK